MSRLTPLLIGFVYVILFTGAPAVAAESASSRLLPPTSHLLVAAPGLVLLSEELHFSCDELQCKVVATATVNAPAAMSVDFSFLAPQGVRIVSMVNGMPELPQVERLQAPATTAPAVPASGFPDLRKADDQAVYRGNLWSPRVLGEFVEANDMALATFTARLQEGANRLTISYTQPLAWFTTASGGRRVSLLQYELWPLAQWSRDPAFSLQLSLRLQRPQPGWWQEKFGRVLQIDGYTATIAGVRTPLAVKAVQDNNDLLLRETFAGAGVERLVFVIGEAGDLEKVRTRDALVSP